MKIIDVFDFMPVILRWLRMPDLQWTFFDYLYVQRDGFLPFVLQGFTICFVFLEGQ